MQQNEIIDISAIEGIGEEAWNERRKLWTTPIPTLGSIINNNNHMNESTTNELKELTVSDSNKLQIYQSLINERRSFKKPLPLGTVVDVIVYGWKNNGTM
ncbi:hypothetical protein BJ944DRAFT_269592 [Cunninghamella echinulata]|nr:hypothetical protein BJ944DRAFT_269592 [Cunninghamella echinulata]